MVFVLMSLGASAQVACLTLPGTPSVTAVAPQLIMVSGLGSCLAPGFYVATNGNDSSAGAVNSPFATLGQCQTAMLASSTVKTCYIRAGTYANLPKVTLSGSVAPTQAALMLTSADNTTTWSYYPPDGYNTAILNGGNTSTGATAMCQNTALSDYGIYIEGGSHITINGLVFKNFTFGGVALHGGGSYFGNWFPTGNLGSGTADSDLIENNIMQSINNGNPTAAGICTSPAWPPALSSFNSSGGGVTWLGQVTNLTVTHNAIINTLGPGADAQMFATADNMSGLVVSYNFVLNTNQAGNDQGCVHLYNYASSPGTQGILTSASYTYNYLRDCGGSVSSSPYGDARALFVDDGVSHVTATGNIIAGHMRTCFDYHGGNNNLYYGNICDLGDGALGTQSISVYQDSAFCSGSGCMANNMRRNNILIANASITMGGDETFITGSTPLTTQNELAHTYGSGSVTDSASVSSVEPQLSCWTYNLASNSPAYNSPVSFPAQPGNWGQAGFWGPPGYTIPHTGTPPSSPHSC